MEKKKMAKALVLTAALAGGLTFAHSFTNEAQASGTNYIISSCYKNGSWNNYQCTGTSVGNCSAKTSCQ